MRINPESIARASSRHPWWVVGTWVAVIAVGLASVVAFLSQNLSTSFEFTDNPESKVAADLLEDRLRGPAVYSELVVISAPLGTGIDGYLNDLRLGVEALGSDTVAAVADVGPDGFPIASPDGAHRLVSIHLSVTDLDGATAAATALAGVIDSIEAPAGVEARLFGAGTISNDFERLAEEGTRRGETIGVSVALVVLLVVIGAAVAAVLPLLLAAGAIVAAMGLTAFIGNYLPLSFTVVSFITMMGLAVGIDYALFVVARYREERRAGVAKHEAIGRAGATANRTVFFSGLTVLLALSGLLVIPGTVFRSVGLGAMTVVLMAVAASMTLLPAVLSLLGDRIDRGRVRRRAPKRTGGGVWDRIATGVMRRPVVWLVAAGGLMILLAVPALRLETGFSGVSTLPDDVESKQAFEILEEGFGLGGMTDPAEVVIDAPITPEIESAVENLMAALASEPVFGPPLPLEVNPAGDLALLAVPLTGDPEAAESHAAVERLRSDLIPEAFAGTGATVVVGGTTAWELDFLEDIDGYTPIIFTFVLGLSFLLLTVVFRSIVVPIKAILLNLLSVGATYGTLVLAFQEGTGPAWLKDALPFIQVEAVESWVPLMLFTVLFGLSMDYHVFLLTRIREHFDATGDNTAAVAHGLRSTGAIITGAALIMVAVFAGFALGELSSVQQMGFGLGVAVLLDATIVRSVLVPASMRLLGTYNWYLPSWLGWLPHLDVEGPAARPQVAAPALASSTTKGVS